MKCKTLKRNSPSKLNRSACLLLVLAVALAAALACSSHAPKARKDQGVYYPDVFSFFGDPNLYKGFDVHLDSLRVVEIKEDRPMVLKGVGASGLLYVTDNRSIAINYSLVPGDSISIDFFCGEGSLVSGNILKSIQPR